MKFRFSLFLLAFLYYGIAYGQNTFPNAGFAGIGTSTPEAPLEIFIGSGSKPGGITAVGQSILKISRSGTHNYSYNEAADFRLSHGGPSVWGSRLDLFVNGGNNQNNVPDQHTMSWLYNGSVGIGTVAPRSLLDLGSVINEGKLGAVLGRLLEGNQDGEGTFLGVRGYNTTAAYGFKSFGLEHSFYGITNSSINFLRGGSQTGGCITFNTNANVEQMRLDVNGNLLIGKTSQANSSYKLDVEGKVRVREIVVNTDGADFVFDENYTLRPLSELDIFVKKFKRLPEIPSAKIMKKEGMSVGELQTKLLQKVEELTLYLIDKDKQLEVQKALNRKYEERLSELEKLFNKIPIN